MGALTFRRFLLPAREQALSQELELLCTLEETRIARAECIYEGGAFVRMHAGCEVAEILADRDQTDFPQALGDVRMKPSGLIRRYPHAAVIVDQSLEPGK